MSTREARRRNASTPVPKGGGDSHSFRPIHGAGIGSDADSDFEELAAVAKAPLNPVQVVRVVEEAWQKYELHDDIAGRHADQSHKQLSAHSGTSELRYQVTGTWSEVVFLECLQAAGGAGTAIAMPRSVRDVQVVVKVTAVGQVDLGAIMWSSMEQVKASLVYRSMLLLLALLVAWLALHFSSYDHFPWTVAPFRWVMEVWPASSSS